MKRVIGPLVAALALLSAPARADDDGFRLHGGFTAEGGYMKTFAQSDVSGGLGGATVRIGAGIAPWLSVYYENRFRLAFLKDDTTKYFGYVDDNVIRLSAIVLDDRAELGIGPSITAGRANALNLNGFGYDVRLAFFAKGAEKVRQGLSIVSNVHHTIGNEQSYLNVTVGLGYEWY